MTDLDTRYPNAHRFKFAEGSTRELCEWLTQLALDGKKTGTCWPLKEVANGEPMLEPGDVAIYTDWDDKPVLAVEYLKIEIHEFDHVPEGFALSEGENDSLQGWREDHKRYHQRLGNWSDNMEMVCETFRVIARASDPA